MNLSAWRGRNVFVTGHTGFKGSWLALWLQHLGANVSGYALAPAVHRQVSGLPTADLFELARIDEIIDSTIGDLGDREFLGAAMRRSSPEIVFHLAAQSLVRQSYRDPVETFSSNVLGTAHVLEAVRHTPSVQAVVVVTSDKCYRNDELSRAFIEDDPVGGRDPYSASKGCTELVVSAYRDSFLAAAGKAVASARAGNAIGGGDWARDRLVPDLIRSIIARQRAEIRHPGAIRPWQHVLEPLHGYLQLAESLVRNGREYAQAWNFGPDHADARSVGWLAARIVDTWGDNAAWDTGEPPPEHEATTLLLDSTRARSRLGWRPLLSLEEALDWTVEWYRHWAGGGRDVRELTLSQIERYGERVVGRAGFEPATT